MKKVGNLFLIKTQLGQDYVEVRINGQKMSLKCFFLTLTLGQLVLYFSSSQALELLVQ